MRRKGWYAETREDLPRFAFRATTKGIVHWVLMETASRPASVRIVSPEGRESTVTFGGFWQTLDPVLSYEVAKALGEA